MKPNPASRQKPAPAAPAQEPAPVDSAAAQRLRDLIQRQGEIETALRETRAERTSGRLVDGVDASAEELLKSATSRPPAGPEKTVVVRTVGVLRKSHQAAERVPLEGVTVRLRHGEKEVAAEKTGAQGLAILHLPEGKAAPYEVEALDPRCQVIACEHGKLSGHEGAVHVLELEESKGLATAFERAQPWLDAASATRLRAAELKKTVATALERQETELKAMLSEVNALLKPCAEKHDPPAASPKKEAAAVPAKPVSTKP